MEPQEIVQAFADAFNAGDLDAVASHLADDFQFSGPIPEPIGAAEYIGLTKTLRAGFPDVNYNYRVVGAEGNVVKTKTQVSGTHTGELDLSALNMGVIPPTGKSFSNPEEESDTTVAGDKITSIHVYSAEGSGLLGTLAQLGIEPPST